MALAVDAHELSRRLRMELDPSGGSQFHHDPAPLVALAQKILLARSMRRTFMSNDFFAEPGWEMLLSLFCADAAGHRMTVSNLCHASCSPDTTALRWLEKLLERDMVRRRSNPLDARVIFIELQPSARSAIRSYLSDSLRVFYG